MIENVISVPVEEIVKHVSEHKASGCRLVTISCTELPEGQLDLLYHFDKDLAMDHIRTTANAGSRIPSISGIYFAALVIENEIQDFFDIRFDGLVVDYNGHFEIVGEEELSEDCSFRPELSSAHARVSVLEKKSAEEAETDGRA